MRFALLVLVACSPAPRTREPVQPPPADAASDATVDAATPDARTAQIPLLQCRQVAGPSNRFPKCMEDGKVVELAKPITLAISRHGTSTDRGTPVVVDGGANLGITARWRATLLDGVQREMEDAAITRVDPDQIEVLAPMTGERIDNFAKTVRFTPPDGERLVIPPPPPKADAVVLAIVRQGPVIDRGTQLLVAGGTKKGIAKTWRAEVLDSNQRPLPYGGASFVRLDPDEIVVVVRLTPDQLSGRAKAVRFTPP